MMSDNINNAILATSILVELYDKLLDLSCSFQEESNEYSELIIRIKHCIKIENEAYEKLSKDELNKCFDEIKGIIIDNDFMARYCGRISYYKKLMDEGIDNDKGLLSGVISAKLTIDLLKKLNIIILDVYNNPDISDDEKDMILMHHISNKFLFLTSNPFLEEYATNYNFNIDLIPEISFNDIEEEFNVNFMDSVSNTLATYIMDGIHELQVLNNDDKYFVAYKSLMEMARVDASLPYLDLKSIKMIEDNYDYLYDKSIVISNIKRKIRARKEELNN